MSPVRHRLTILGSGASPGVPRINGDWGACDPAEPRNRRTRCAAMVERFGDGPRPTRVVIDTGPDFRAQMLAAAVDEVHGVIYTHSHADHVHGIDDLRAFWMIAKRPIDIFTDDATQARLDEGFGYCFSAPEGSPYPPFLRRHWIDAGTGFVVDGPGGPLAVAPFAQVHGDIRSLGFRFGRVAYSCDFNDLPPSSLPVVADLDCWVLDALRPQPHPSHCSLNEAVDWVRRIRPRRAVFTHMTNELDYRTLRRELPAGIEPGFDGVAIDFPV